jgi:hypothetical protein
MLDTIEKPTGAELPLVKQPTKAELIQEELRINSNRSDREIGRVCDVDHKTVAAHRKRLGIATPPGAANSPPLSTAASQTVTNRHGVTLSPDLFPILNAAKRTAEKKFNPFDPDDDCLIAPERLGLACFVNTRDNVVIANGNIRDGIDEMVQINPVDLDGLISRLREIQSEIRDGVYLRDDDAGEPDASGGS